MKRAIIALSVALLLGAAVAPGTVSADEDTSTTPDVDDTSETEPIQQESTDTCWPRICIGNRCICLW